jgi:hypothetical protein
VQACVLERHRAGGCDGIDQLALLVQRSVVDHGGNARAFVLDHPHTAPISRSV